MAVLALGLSSLSVSGSLQISGGVLTLVNDSISPGNSYFYGTSGAGTKGWFALSAFGATSVAGTAGNVLVNGGTAAATGAIVLSLPTALTSINSVTGSTTTDLTLSGGSSGASLVLGQGGNGGTTTTLKGNGAFVINGGASNIPIVRVVADTATQAILSLNNSAQNWDVRNTGTNMEFRDSTAGVYPLTLGAGALGVGYVKVNNTTPATNTTSGAVQIGSNIGLSGNSGGPSYFGGAVISGTNFRAGGTAPASSLAGYTSVELGQKGNMLFGGSNDNWWTTEAYYSSGFKYATTAKATAINSNAGNLIFKTSAGSTADSAITWVDAMTIAATTGTINIPATTSASSSTTGALTIGNGTAATNVAIGGGNINAGGTLTTGGNITAAGATSAPTLSISGANANASPLIYLTSGLGGGSQQQWSIYTNGTNNGEFMIRDNTAAADRVTIAKTTGAMTVGSAALTLGGNAVNAPTITINGLAASDRVLKWQAAGTDKWQLYSKATTDAFNLYSIGGTNTDVLSIAYATGNTTFASTTASTSTTTGSATFAGGVGIAGAVYGGSTVNISGATGANTLTYRAAPSGWNGLIHRMGPQWSGDALSLSQNLALSSSTVGSLDDTAAAGAALTLQAGTLTFSNATAGANTRTVTTHLSISTGGVLSVGSAAASAGGRLNVNFDSSLSEAITLSDYRASGGKGTWVMGPGTGSAGFALRDSTNAKTVWAAATTTGDMQFLSTTEATTSAAGALTVSGGIYSAKAIVANRWETITATLTYSATPSVDFTATGLRTITLTGDAAFAASTNVAAGRGQILRIVGDSVTRNLSFPAGWVFVGGSAPTQIAASKTGMLSLVAFGGTDSTVIAAYSVQS